MNQTASKASLMYSFPELIRKEWYWDYNNVLSIDPKKNQSDIWKTCFLEMSLMWQHLPYDTKTAPGLH